jgi:hypothetical protein
MIFYADYEKLIKRISSSLKKNNIKCSNEKVIQDYLLCINTNENKAVNIF